MASSEWEEVKRLAADFQREQLSSVAQKLSERNCIELVNKLQAEERIAVIYTLDGKEYLTPAQILKEVKDELIVHEGRVNLVDLHQIIGIDFTYIEGKAQELVKSDSNVHLVLGQLIDESYLDHLAEEINDKLNEAGQVSIAELTKSHDLPADFLTEAIERRIGRLIEGQIDPYDKGIIFTQAFVDRHTAQVRGVFSAITKPTSVWGILNQYKFPEKLFYNILENLVNNGRLNGAIVGGRQDNASYMPDIFAKTQNNWVSAFYAQNGYLEFDTLSRLGIPDPKNYIKKRFKSENLMFLSSACIGKGLQEQVDASIDEALSSGSWVDIMPILPSSLSSNDMNQIVQHCLKSKSSSGARVFCDTIVCSKKFIDECNKFFEDTMKEKAIKDAETQKEFFLQKDTKAVAALHVSDGKQDRKDERRKKAASGGGSSKAGGMGTGREVKSKKVQKKNRNRDLDDEGDADQTGSRGHSHELEFLPLSEIEKILRQNLEDCPEELHAELSQELYRPLTKIYQEQAREVFLTAAGGSMAERRKTQDDLKEKINSLWTNVKLFEKGIKQFSDEDLHVQLIKYLLKTLCTEITNLIFQSVASEQMLSHSESREVTVDTRAKILTMVSESQKPTLTKLNATLSGKDLGEFFTQLDAVCDSDICDILLKKTDKKKERSLVFNHRQALCEQLRKVTDPALALHLTITVAFQNCTQCMLHAPGRCVPQIITFLQDHLSFDQHNLLLQCQELVQKQLGLDREKENVEDGAEFDQESESRVKTRLEELVPKVKDVALVKKNVASLPS